MPGIAVRRKKGDFNNQCLYLFCKGDHSACKMFIWFRVYLRLSCDINIVLTEKSNYFCVASPQCNVGISYCS